MRTCSVILVLVLVTALAAAQQDLAPVDTLSNGFCGDREVISRLVAEALGSLGDWRGGIILVREGGKDVHPWNLPIAVGSKAEAVEAVTLAATEDWYYIGAELSCCEKQEDGKLWYRLVLQPAGRYYDQRPHLAAEDPVENELARMVTEILPGREHALKGEDISLGNPPGVSRIATLWRKQPPSVEQLRLWSAADQCWNERRLRLELLGMAVGKWVENNKADNEQAITLCQRLHQLWKELEE